jgi:hypothetical protein
MHLLDERVATPLGPVLLTVEGETGEAHLEVLEATPALPEGSRVDGVMLLRLIFDRQVRRSDQVLVRAAFEASGSPECGEWLESILFETSTGRLSIGVRDQEWLAGRKVAVDWADLQANALTLPVHEAPAGTLLPISLAWRFNPIPEDDASTWFAVDLALP